VKNLVQTGLGGLCLVAILGMAPAAGAATAEQALGVWLTKSGSHVKFYKCGTKLCGKIIKRKNPGELDSKNKNPKLRSRKILGINLMYGLKKDRANRWAGRLYNPEDGKIYTGFVTVISANKVRMEGCVARIFCKSQSWSRVR